MEVSTITSSATHFCLSWKCWHSICWYVRVRVFGSSVIIGIGGPCSVCCYLHALPAPLCVSCLFLISLVIYTLSAHPLFSLSPPSPSSLLLSPSLTDKAKNVSLSFANNFKDVIDFVRQHNVRKERGSEKRGNRRRKLEQLAEGIEGARSGEQE